MTFKNKMKMQLQKPHNRDYLLEMNLMMPKDNDDGNIALHVLVQIASNGWKNATTKTPIMSTTVYS